MTDEQSRDMHDRIWSPRINAYPPPVRAIDDFSEIETDKCVCISLNAQWVRFLTGILDDLLDPIYWSDNYDLAEQSIAELQAALHGVSETMNCQPSVLSIDIDANGQLILNLSNGTTLEVATEFVFGLGVNADGSWSWQVGDTIINQGDLTVEFPDIFELAPAEEGTYPQDNICAGVFGAVDWLLATITDIAQQWIDEWTSAQSAVHWMTSIIASIPGIELTNLPIVTVSDIVFYIHIESMTDAVDNMNNQAMIDAVREALYCAIRANDDTLTQAIFETWCADELSIMDVDLIGTGGGRFNVSEFAGDVVAWRLFHPRYRLYSLDSENDCRLLEWCGESSPPDFVFDFDPNDQKGWYKNTTPNPYTAGNWNAASGRWEQSSTGWQSGTLVRCDIEYTWAAPVIISRVKVQYQWSWSVNGNQPKYIAATLGANDGTGHYGTAIDPCVEVAQADMVPPDGTLDWTTFDFDDVETSVLNIALQCVGQITTPPNPQGLIRIYAVHVWGYEA